MLSIGRFAKLVNVSPRTVRFYESIGLISSVSRGENNYRYYDNSLVQKFSKIEELQSLGFSLEEIKQILQLTNGNLTQSLQKKLSEVAADINNFELRKERLEKLLSVSHKIELKKSINETERKQYMDAIKEEIVNALTEKYGSVSEEQLKYLNRDVAIYGTPQKQEFFEAIKKCVKFAKDHNLKLGPGRGSSPSSMVLHAIGFNEIDPSLHQLFPERISTMVNPDFHIDVEFERGQEFVDYCREISSGLSYGQINAFKMPLIDIVNNVHKAIGKEINYQSIEDDADIVLNHFRKAEIEKIFLFDLSENALVMKYENLLPEYLGLKKITEYLKDQRIDSFRDVVNITALWRPHSPEIVERLQRYALAKEKPHRYNFLTPELQKSLEPNYGLVIYHEDIIRIMAEYTGWDFERCNRLRRDLQFNEPNVNLAELAEFKKTVPQEVSTLILQENPWAFCQPHAIAFARFTKQTAVLKSLYKEIYFREITLWEQKYGFVWDDIGIKIKGVSLLQS